MLEYILERVQDENGDIVYGGQAAAVFFYWCSLPQQPRTAEQQSQFEKALKHINIWYAHSLTIVWMLTRVPAGVRAYEERGWPCFETAVSSMLKDSNKAVDLRSLRDNWQTLDTEWCSAWRQTYISLSDRPKLYVSSRLELVAKV